MTRKAPAKSVGTKSFFSIRSTIARGIVSCPAGVSSVTRPPLSVTFDAIIRRPFFRTIVSAEAADTTARQISAIGVTRSTSKV